MLTTCSSCVYVILLGALLVRSIPNPVVRREIKGPPNAVSSHRLHRCKKVSIITGAHPFRRDIAFNALVNFMKQDYEGPLELVYTTGMVSKMASAEPLFNQLMESMSTYPNITGAFSTALLAGEWPAKTCGWISATRNIVFVNGSGHLGSMRNQAVNASTGKIIVNMDDDDVYDPTYVTRLVNHFSVSKTAWMVYEPYITHHHVQIDGSVSIESGRVGPDAASTHAFRREAWEVCPYGSADGDSSESHSMLKCIQSKARMAGLNENTYFQALTERSSHGLGVLKVWWASRTCNAIWKSSMEKKLDYNSTFNAILSYRKRVSRNLHYLQNMAGGYHTLERIRHILKIDEPAGSDSFPPADLQKDGEFEKSAECNDWRVYLSPLSTQSSSDGHGITLESKDSRTHTASISFVS